MFTCCFQKKLFSPAESMFSVGELNNLFKEQLEMEKKTFVKVKSIEKTQLERDTQYCVSIYNKNY